MITIKYEIYHWDFDRRNYEKSFTSLNSLKDWLFEQQDYLKYEESFAFYFPQSKERIGRISVNKANYRGSIWINEIFKDGRIIFSDGTYTNGQKHISNECLEWCKECEKARYNATFDFED